MALDFLSIAITFMQEVWCEISQSTSDLLNNVEHNIQNGDLRLCAYRQDLHK